MAANETPPERSTTEPLPSSSAARMSLSMSSSQARDADAGAGRSFAGGGLDGAGLVWPGCLRAHSLPAGLDSGARFNVASSALTF